jgi:hypothetical protein
MDPSGTFQEWSYLMAEKWTPGVVPRAVWLFEWSEGIRATLVTVALRGQAVIVPQGRGFYGLQSLMSELT